MDVLWEPLVHYYWLASCTDCWPRTCSEDSQLGVVQPHQTPLPEVVAACWNLSLKEIPLTEEAE